MGIICLYFSASKTGDVDSKTYWDWQNMDRTVG